MCSRLMNGDDTLEYDLSNTRTQLLLSVNQEVPRTPHPYSAARTIKTRKHAAARRVEHASNPANDGIRIGNAYGRRSIHRSRAIDSVGRQSIS